ncbi:MAG: DUF2147 domain-containing protein [Saprospiraceae bacterium]
MKFFNLLVLFSFLSTSILYAQNQAVLGLWKTIDDTDGKTKSIVELYLKGDKLYAKVIELLPNAIFKICNNCPGEKAGKSLIQMDIVWEMRSDGQEWSGGQIVDPKNGKVYSCVISLESQNRLKVRGYVGLSLFGRTQVWERMN